MENLLQVRLSKEMQCSSTGIPIVTIIIIIMNESLLLESFKIRDFVVYEYTRLFQLI